jgi:microcystin-dependent protein
MSTKKIEIFENTLLKLLIRRGTDNDRKNVILSEGELGYTTDTKRLFVGDSQTIGGVVAGNVFKGVVSNLSLVTDAEYGDLTYDLNGGTLYVNISSNTWEPVSRNFVTIPGNDTINITGSTISVGTISSANLSNDVVGNSVELDISNRISLNGTQISTNSIVPRIGSYLSLPQGLSINNVPYNWPAGGTGEGLYLRTDIAGNLAWATASAPNTFFVSGTAGQIPVGTIMPFVSSANAPFGWLLCNGQSVAGSQYPQLSAVIGTTFGGSGGNFNVPNLINKTIYGVNNNPAGSTTFSIASGTNSALSATGALYIIKAVSDNIISSSIDVFSPLSATLNGVTQTGAFNPLSGSITISLETTSLTGTTNILGGFVADEYGRVLQEVGDLAGVSSAQPPGTQPIYNRESSPIGFFTTPAYIFNGVDSLAAQILTLTAYPTLTASSGTITNGSQYSIPPNAKYLIFEAFGTKRGPSSGNENRIVTAAPNTSLLSNNTYGSFADTEYVLWYARASTSSDHVAGNNTSFIPLSATSNGALTVAVRVGPSSNDNITLRILGYTL